MTGYQPGYCNIGRRQRRQRLRVAAVAFGIAAVCVLGHLWGTVPSALLVAVFVPLSIGYEWGIQASTGFCVRLALLNRYDFRRSDGGTTGTVNDASDRRDDRVQAANITVAAVGLAAATTGILVFVLG